MSETTGTEFIVGGPLLSMTAVATRRAASWSIVGGGWSREGFVRKQPNRLLFISSSSGRSRRFCVHVHTLYPSPPTHICLLFTLTFRIILNSKYDIILINKYFYSCHNNMKNTFDQR